MVSDIYHPSLKTHKLMGNLDDIWACSIDYSYRILFEFAIDPERDERAILWLNERTGSIYRPLIPHP
jgi:mRNA-degrading endonuclease YafQ of YafQ-DinJ toxin-antitoxin module